MKIKLTQATVFNSEIAKNMSNFDWIIKIRTRDAKTRNNEPLMAK